MTAKNLLMVASLFLWAGVVLTGFGLLHTYHNKAGQRGAVPVHWPTCALQLDSERSTLVIALHGQCPCSRTSVGQLNEILLRCAGKLRVHVLVFEPANRALGGVDLSELAGRDGVGIHNDPDGVLASRFGMLTSGHTVLFDVRGRRLFSGGITRGRGLEGSNVGQEAILAHVLGQEKAPTTVEVFGCPLPSHEEYEVAIP